MIRLKKSKNIFLLLQPFHKQQGWCPAGKKKQFLIKGK
jgi:hypothetical protein